MKLPEEEKAAHKAAFKAMSPGEKADYIFTYFKWPIILGLVALIILVSTLHRQLTKKEPVLYLAVINVTLGEDMETKLTADFLKEAGFSERKNEVYLYRDLYISEDTDEMNHEYAYASKMKVVGAVSAEKLDLVLLNQEAYDLLSRQGYLLELSSLPAELSPLVTENEVILSDNSIDYLLGNEEEEEFVTKTVSNAIAVSSLPLFQDAGFDGEVYLGVIGNSPRKENVESYLRYIGGCR